MVLHRFLTSALILVGGSTCSAIPAFAEDAAAISPLPAGTAKKQITETLDEVIKVVTSLPGDENLRERRKQLRAVITPRFDFKEMAKRSLGSNWQGITPEQQVEFVDLFSELLAKTYLSHVETVKPGMVKIDGEDIETNLGKGLVRTTVNNKGEFFPLNYRVMQKDGEWKVYDVIVENIGLVANYRSEFAGIMRKDKFEGLLEKLRKKINT